MPEQSKKYEIVNPSDKCFLTSPSLLLAAVAICLLGEGSYALTDTETGEKAVPLFLFGGHDAFFQEKFGITLNDAIGQCTAPENAPQLAEVLQSVEYDSKPGSLNNIKDRADQLALMVKDLASARAEEAQHG